MKKEDKFQVGLALNKIALAVDNYSFNKIKGYLETIEDIIEKEPEEEE